MTIRKKLVANTEQTMFERQLTKITTLSNKKLTIKSMINYMKSGK